MFDCLVSGRLRVVQGAFRKETFILFILSSQLSRKIRTTIPSEWNEQFVDVSGVRGIRTQVMGTWCRFWENDETDKNAKAGHIFFAGVVGPVDCGF